MNIMNLLTFFFLFTFSSIQVPVDSQFVLLRGRVGPVILGMTVDQLLRLYDRSHFQFVDLQLEGLFSPAIIVTYGNQFEPFLRVEYSSNQGQWIINRILLQNKKFQASKGIAIGSTLGDLRHYYTVDWIDFGEGDVIARVDELGMSFILDVTPLGDNAFSQVRNKTVPDSLKITSILLTE
jgi:hypothetical protein